MIYLKDFVIGQNQPLVLIAGPCVVENEKMILSTAEEIGKIASKLKVHFIFKSSFKKANRTSLDSFASLGDKAAVAILRKVKYELNFPVITDIHLPDDVDLVGDAADVLQIPAFLCRQTELLIAAGSSGKIINIKKGQFLSPEEMKYAATKVESTGNKKIMLTERGTTFGYHNLVVDMRSLIIMRELGYPVIMDATHSVQLPGASGMSGGQPKFIKPLAKAAAAVGIDGLFLEVHPNPQDALSDAHSQLPLSQLESLLTEVMEIDNLVKSLK
jgi:2-dehydro-3-deoxyphosphooctonate aldolase (KDO 8-P synthase)